jgi:general stress protein 26
MGQRMHEDGETAKLWDLIKDIQFAMMTTVDDDSGVLRSRPMAINQDRFDGQLWFFTYASSHKVLEVRQHQAVNVSFAEPEDQHYVSISGTAELVRDKAKAKELWKEPLRTWFPKGLDDPDLALLKVTVEQAEYWDSPSSTVVHAVGYVKSLVTGEPPKMGENKKLNF